MEGIIKNDSRDLGSDHVGWIELIEYRVLKRAFVTTVP
jgi:hypothetical protein